MSQAELVPMTPGGGLISGAVGGLLDGMMREIWTGTLGLLRAVMGLVGELGSLDVTPGGGAISQELWTSMLQLAALIAVTLFFAQLAAAALNPRRHMLQAATGPVQYGIALALSVALVAGLLGAADGLSAIILQQGANVTDTAAALDQLGLVDDNNAVKATVLGLLGIIAVVPLAIGYGITLLFRSASILVLVATLPITAAGLTNLATKSWFWRVSRWLLALIFLKPAFALCFALGSGIVAAAGRTETPPPGAPAPPAPPAASGAPDGALAPPDGTGVVTLLLGLGIMFVALFAPYALFRLFAFIEPGTQPHQAMMSAFSSATAGFKSTVGGAANADIGSVLSGATGGRFAGDAGTGGGGALGGMLPGGSGGSGDDSKKEQAAAAGLAVATGGASAAAGAGAAGGASSGAAGGSSGAGGAGGAARPIAASAGSGGSGSGGNGDGPDTREQEAVEDESGALAGAGAAGSGGGGGASGSGVSGGGVSGGASGSPGSGGGWSVASKAAAAAGSVGSAGGGRVGAAASALGGAASGVGAGAAGIAGAAPMPPSPMGGATGSVGDHGLGDYSGGHLGASVPRAPIPPRAVHSYRDESFDDRNRDDEDDQDDQGVAGVL